MAKYKVREDAYPEFNVCVYGEPGYRQEDLEACSVRVMAGVCGYSVCCG
jgi:hypothetical protein